MVDPQVPMDLLYNRDHYWVRLEDGFASFGLTDHAQNDLGDVVYLQLPRVGEEAYTLSDHVISYDTGLVMIDVGRTPPEDLQLLVEPRSDAGNRRVPYSLITITWDGKTFVIEEKDATSDPKQIAA